MEVLDVDAGLTRVAGAGAESPLTWMWLEQVASVRVVGALQERLVCRRVRRATRSCGPLWTPR